MTACTSAPGISMSWRARTFPEVADRAAQEARAEVSPSTRAALSTGSKNVAPYFGPLRVVGRLAHQPGLEQRPERHRHRRLGDPDAARDLRARDRGAGADGVEHRALVEIAQQRRRRGRTAGGRAHAPSRSPLAASNRCGASSGRGRRLTRSPRAARGGRRRGRRDAPARRPARRCRRRTRRRPAPRRRRPRPAMPSAASSSASGRRPTTTLARPFAARGRGITQRDAPPSASAPSLERHACRGSSRASR